MSFGIHPSGKLQKLYADKPYQMQAPEDAKIIFVGLDANWDINIEQDPLFPEFEEYLKDGVSYWKTHGYHTPMLNPAYKGGGRKYHRMFADIGFTPAHAKDICFFELLKFPTYGNSTENGGKEYKKLVCGESNKEHLNRLRELQKDKRKKIFIPNGQKLRKIIDSLNVFDSDLSNVVFHKHFSRITLAEIDIIRGLCFETLNQ